jgi:hypothetical protein
LTRNSDSGCEIALLSDAANRTEILFADPFEALAADAALAAYLRVAADGIAARRRSGVRRAPAS